MAEGLLFDTVGKILEVLASQIFHEIGLAYGVQDDISNLRDTVDTIQAVLLDAEDKHSRKDHAVTIWLRRLKDAVYAAEDLLDDFSTEFLRRKLMSGSRVTKEVLLFFSKYNQFAYALEMGRKIKAIRERLESIKNDRQFHLLQQPYERRVENTRRETHSFVHKEDIIGRDGDKNEIIDRLLDSSESEIESVAVIPIVGIGGLGKTAVAQLVYNDEDVKTHFNLRMWVCVSDVFGVTTIVEKMIRSATNRESEKLDLDQLQERLRGEIDGKRYLLVLDDVWNENRDKWLELEALLMNGVSGSKIVVTTRSERVARITSKLPFHALRGLPEDMQLNESYCNKIVSSFKCLRTLNLSNSEIETVPSLIGKLKHLRYFNLSHNADIKSLPDSVSRLLNLQTLDLSCCDDLVELPRDIGKMVSLRHLAIESCLSLTDMPNGLGQLTNLRTLPLFMVGRKTQLSQLNGLNKLRGSLRIENLGEKQNSRLANLEAKEGLQSLVLQWDANKTVIYIDDALLEGLKPHQNLKELTIIRFGGIRLSSWLSSVTNLTMIDISICIKCQYIPELDQLPSLKRLRLFKLSALEYISSSSPPSTTIFPSLEELRIFACPELKGWWRTDGSTTQTAEPPFSHPLQQTMMRTTNTAEPPFSKLKSLTIESIDDLETWPEEMMPNFPSIQNISIELCPKLISLPQRLNKATTLKTVGIYDCPNMAILPEGLQLQSLEIIQCPQLSERCGNNMAVDWPKIAHIPNIRIDNDLIQLGDAIN
ncbi:hypothetical protein CUMW_167260 [Citrus unshiu]|uniref:Rx N-terminal domain-containing protein n=1 Tax=Citrus unshiu TaxID=55188 RepID=A0A2H5PU15_CITUN|nr:hypothetical protein CUMW_167260 [Citrus unshiu]